MIATITGEVVAPVTEEVVTRARTPFHGEFVLDDKQKEIVLRMRELMSKYGTEDQPGKFVLRWPHGLALKGLENEFMRAISGGIPEGFKLSNLRFNGD